MRRLLFALLLGLVAAPSYAADLYYTQSGDRNVYAVSEADNRFVQAEKLSDEDLHELRLHNELRIAVDAIGFLERDTVSCARFEIVEECIHDLG